MEMHGGRRRRRRRRRRFRRRRRSCHAVSCGWHWNSWSACNCRDQRTRSMAITRNPSCGGSACPSVRHQVEGCSGPCASGGGSCSNGRCSCYPGRTGRRCESTCSYKRYGVNCAQHCNCHTGCNPTNGACHCNSVSCGWHWNSWSTCNCHNKRTRTMTITRSPSCGGSACPSSKTQDESCNGSCASGGGVCNNGVCKCNPGRNGTRCESTCSYGTYGVNCAQTCNCSRGCDPKTGVCNCSPVNCTWTLNPWSCNCFGQRTRGILITRQASCGGNACPSNMTESNGTCTTGYCTKEGGVCNGRNGLCTCHAGRNGSRCESTCPSGTYGKNCANQCNCIKGVECDPKDGFCKCPVGRYGKRCEMRYYCNRRSECFHLKNPVVNYKYCFVQRRIATTKFTAYTSCPRRTHYANRCQCFPNCIPVSMYNSQHCHCKCKAPDKTSVPSAYRGKYVTLATCCPRRL